MNRLLIFQILLVLNGIANRLGKGLVPAPVSLSQNGLRNAFCTLDREDAKKADDIEFVDVLLHLVNGQRVKDIWGQRYLGSE